MYGNLDIAESMVKISLIYSSQRDTTSSSHGLTGTLENSRQIKDRKYNDQHCVARRQAWTETSDKEME